MLSNDSTIEQLLSATNFLSPAQEMALAYCLEDVTVQDLLDMPTAQALANIIAEEAATLHAQSKRNPGSLTYEFGHEGQARIAYRDIGTIVYKLLRYVHRMFDPLCCCQTATRTPTSNEVL